MANERRVFRVAERLREILARELLQLADPRFELVTISSVVLSSDLMEAKVFWQTFNSTKERIAEVTEAFKSAQGLLRSVAGKGLEIRFVPNLRFIYDDTLDVSDKVSELIKRAHEKDGNTRYMSENLPLNLPQCLPLGEVARVLKNSQRVAVAAHYKPDPDAYGSSCALTMGLRLLGKEVVNCNQDGATSGFDYIPGVKEVSKEPPAQPVDILVLVDCSEFERLGDTFAGKLRGLAPVVNIDHHISNTLFGTYNLVWPNVGSSSEIVFDLLKELGCPITLEIAEALLAGIMSDTGSFRYSSTNPKTLRAAAELMEAGARIDLLAQGLYGSMRLPSVRLQSDVLLNFELLCEGRLALGIITPDMFKRYSADNNDTELLVDRLRDIRGVQIGALISREPDYWKVNLRSKNAIHNVSAVAAEFKGGGHRQAAACRWRGEFAELKERLVERLARELNGADDKAGQ